MNFYPVLDEGRAAREARESLDNSPSFRILARPTQLKNSPRE